MEKAHAIAHFGSVSALAEALGIAPAAISQWDAVPELRQYQLQVITAGKLVAKSNTSTKVIDSKCEGAHSKEKVGAGGTATQ